MNVSSPKGALHSFSNKIIFYDEMDWRLFYFNVTTYWDSDIPWKILTISSEIFLKVHQCILHISRAHISKIKMCYNAESSVYFF